MLQGVIKSQSDPKRPTGEWTLKQLVLLDVSAIGLTRPIVLSQIKIEAPGSDVGSRALEQPSPRTAHGANLGGLDFNIKET